SVDPPDARAGPRRRVESAAGTRARRRAAALLPDHPIRYRRRTRRNAPAHTVGPPRARARAHAGCDMTRLYRALLRLYPASFRREYGDELTAIFAHRVSERGQFAALMEAVADVISSAVAAHADILRQDLRYTARAMRRAPGFVATAVLVVALGVGANTAAFTLTDFVLLRPLPFPEPDRLGQGWETTPG